MVITLNPLLKVSAGQWNTLVKFGLALCALADQDCIGTNRFADLSDARAWAARFVHWYNLEHRHSGIRYVTPAQRHSGQDVEILKRRDELYQQARRCHPARWARHTRNWDHIAVVKLNPERDSEPIETPASALDKAPRCA